MPKYVYDSSELRTALELLNDHKLALYHYLDTHEEKLNLFNNIVKISSINEDIKLGTTLDKFTDHFSALTGTEKSSPKKRDSKTEKDIDHIFSMIESNFKELLPKSKGNPTLEDGELFFELEETKTPPTRSRAGSSEATSPAPARAVLASVKTPETPKEIATTSTNLHRADGRPRGPAGRRPPTKGMDNAQLPAEKSAGKAIE